MDDLGAVAIVVIIGLCLGFFILAPLINGCEPFMLPHACNILLEHRGLQ